ncbi:MAG: methyl-accepting chemotaxis protein, partial [Gemmatimonadales bacterium]|nr:methyl-accepting chemotaxis protein [Gemmatimonadales bacterium]
MLGFRDWSVKAKLTLLVGLSAVGLMAVAGLSIRTINHVKVYVQEIVIQKDLLADVLPPPVFLLETYLVDNRIVMEAHEGDRREYVARGDQLVKDFGARREVWARDLVEGKERDLVLQQVVPTAVRYLAVRDSAFLPSVRAGDLAAARRVVDGPLTEAYKAHRAAVDELVQLSTATYAELEGQAKVIDVLPKREIFGISVGILVLIGVLGGLVVRQVVSSLGRTVAALNTAATGDLTTSTGVTTRDEFGTIATALDQFLGTLRSSMGAIGENSTALAATA